MKEQEKEIRLQQVEQIRFALFELSEEDRVLISLRFLEEKSNQEIAGILKVDNRHVAVKVHRALNKLRRACEKKFPSFDSNVEEAS